MKTMILIIPVLCIIGWGMNIYKVSKLDFKPAYKAEIIRIVGVVIPVVGAVTGYMDIEDK